MRIASFNVENLFSRARVLNEEEWKDGKEVLNAYSRLTTILQKPVYSSSDKSNIVKLLQTLGLGKTDESSFVILRRNRGTLLDRTKSGAAMVTATGRAAWVGWLELKKEAVNEVATRMTARVIQDVNADVIGVIEAEDRIALKRFNEQLLKPLGAAYHGIMLIDGNDERGIDVGLLAKTGYAIESLVSHVDDTGADGRRIFSRDCPEFTVRAGTDRILVMLNHFKSKGYGDQATNDARRRVQAQRVRELYDQRRAEGQDKIAIIGDFNDTPEREPLQPLLSEGSDLQDIAAHPNFQSDGKVGTFANGTKSNKIDYILLSPALFSRVTSAGVERRGVWGGKHGTLFPHYPEMTRDIHAASDHAALWADLDL